LIDKLVKIISEKEAGIFEYQLFFREKSGEKAKKSHRFKMALEF
jgi:hypothetical protein